MKKITFYKRIYIRHRLKKNVPNCSSVNKNIGDLLRVITTLFVRAVGGKSVFTLVVGANKKCV
jgi:hypothetical protein